MPNRHEPDIVITAEELDTISKFFKDPTPPPLPPISLVETRCTKTHKTYYLIFEQTGPHAWVLQGCLEDLPATSSVAATDPVIQSDVMSGSIDWSSISTDKARCPHCSAQAAAKCGRCNKLSCHPDGRQGSLFQCPWCGETGHLSGRIERLDGWLGKGEKKKL